MNPDQTNPMFLSKDRVKQIIQGAPSGTTPLGIIAGLREKGYKLEGYDQASQAPTTTPAPDKTSSILSGIGNFFKGVFSPTIPGLTDVGVGALKSVGDTAVGTYQLGQKLGNKVSGALGLPQQQIVQSPEVLKSTSPEQDIGKVIGEVAQFFAPGSAEIKAGEGIDKLVDAGKFAEKFGPEAGKALNGILKVIGHGLTTGASTAGVTAVQTGGDVGKTETAGALGFLAGGAGKAIELLGKPLANALTESSLKLSPTKQAELGGKLDKTVNWITDNIGAGTPTGRYNKAVKIVENNEATLQKFLSTDAKDITVKKSDFLKQLEDLKGNFTNERDALAIDKQIDDVIKTVKAKQPDNIPVANLNKFKRSTFASAYNKAGTKVLDWVEAFVGNTAKTAIEDATKGMTIDGKAIGEFNAEYGNALQAKNLLKLAKNKSQVGLSGKALLLLLGSPAGIPGEAAGLLLGGSSGLATAIKTGAGAVAKNVGSTLPIAGAKIGLGISDTTNQESPPQ